MEWRILVVDDLEADSIAEMIGGTKTVKSPDSIRCTPCTSFTEAVKHLTEQRFDLVILDLKDDNAAFDGENAGVRVFDRLKELRFIPVIFHTGHAHKVDDLASPFVKVVRRSEWEVLRSAIKEVLDTKLPKLVRHIEEAQRSFMWESAERVWSDNMGGSTSSDLAYLLARRLSHTLSGEVVRRFLEKDGGTGAPASDKVHAVELYIYPAVSQHLLFGDILQKSLDDAREYFVALTPTCDHAKGSADHVLLAQCIHLTDTHEGKKFQRAIAEGDTVSNTMRTDVIRYIRDNSKPADRYKFLPGTSFMPDLLVDFQRIFTVPFGSLTNAVAGGGEYSRIASLDSPFAESLQAKMSRYLGRIGTPDLDADLALERLIARLGTTSELDVVS